MLSLLTGWENQKLTSYNGINILNLYGLSNKPSHSGDIWPANSFGFKNFIMKRILLFL